STTPFGVPSSACSGPERTTPAISGIKKRGDIHLHLFFSADGMLEPKALTYERTNNPSGSKRKVTNG
ncbi:hypothetical protein ACC771_16575, partial [Rhizobium ruizarguesonis]